ncbi:fish-egg lectin-like [Dendropsophus ebraccatus]|uniref:fish-egg lectin-like n=1 Tax=Dendropsophus ebraccatus TaxID=150705 RepID=UPI00383187DA
MSFILGLLLLCAGASVVAADFHKCSIIPGRLKQVDVSDGEVYGVNDEQRVYRMVDDQWQELPGRFIHVTVGPAGVWAVTEENHIYTLQDDQWEIKSGLLKQLDAGGDKFLVGVNAEDSIYCLSPSMTMSTSSDVTYDTVDGALKYYSCGPLGCWGVNSEEKIYYRSNVSPLSCQGSDWQPIEGSLVMVEVSRDGSVYGVNSSGDVYRRDGISVRSPAGTSWSPMGFCTTFKHVSHDGDYLWLISKCGEIYKCLAV